MTTTSRCAFPHKQRHLTKEKALAHITSLTLSGKGSPDMTAYPCRDTETGEQHWHVGHDARKFRNRIRRSIAYGRNPQSTFRRRTR